MTHNEQSLNDTENGDESWDIHNSPFFTDFDPDVPTNPIGFSIPRPHRPITRTEFTRDMTDYLKKLTEISEPAQTV